MTTPLGPSETDEALRAAWRDLTDAVPAPGVHLTDDDWVRLASDELDDDTRWRWADHIVACPGCTEVFRTVSHVRRHASAFDPGAPSVPDVHDGAADAPVAVAATPSWSAGRWYGLAAAAAVALAVGTVLWRQTPAPELRPRVAQSAGVVRPTGTSDPVAVAPPVAASSAPSPRDWAALATAPAITLPASFTIVMRGETNPAQTAFMAAFGPAIAPYRSGRYAEAATALQALTERFPAVDEGWFYLGVAHLYAGRPDDALEPLRRARHSEVVSDQARWLEAVALERAGRSDEATAVLGAVCAADRVAHLDACALVSNPPGR